MGAPDRLIVLVPHALGIADETLALLEQLREGRVDVRRLPAQPDITQARSAMASWVLVERPEAEWLLWLDADMGVSAEQILRLLANASGRDLDALCLGYACKGPKSGRLAVQLDPGIGSYTLGRRGDLLPITGCGFGCCLVRRRVYEAVAATLPRCSYRLPERYFPPGVVRGWPFHATLVAPADLPTFEGEHVHHGEDFSLVRRSMALGHRWWWDTRERIGHWGPYRYEWEDAGFRLPREESIHVEQKPAAPRRVALAGKN